MVDFCNLHDGYFALPSEAVVMYYIQYYTMVHKSMEWQHCYSIPVPVI